MSVTDRAFIKAYSPRTQREPLTAQAVARREMPDPAARREPLSALVPSNASNSSVPAAPPVTPTEAASAAVQPLSSFVPEVQVQQGLVPALEVERFRWPEVCDELIKAAGKPFDGWAAKLTSTAMAGHNLILLCGMERCEGRTTALLCVAKRLAACGVRTVLVDADFQSPGLAEALGVMVTTGWEDVLAGGAPLEEALVVSPQDELTLLPLGDAPARPQALARSLQVPVGLRMLADQFDLVLIDAGPAAGAGSTAALLMQQVPDAGVVLVRNSQSAEPAAFDALTEQLQAAELRLLGVAETFCPPQSLNHDSSSAPTPV